MRNKTTQSIHLARDAVLAHTFHVEILNAKLGMVLWFKGPHFFYAI